MVLIMNFSFAVIEAREGAEILRTSEACFYPSIKKYQFVFWVQDEGSSFNYTVFWLAVVKTGCYLMNSILSLCVCVLPVCLCLSNVSPYRLFQDRANIF